MDPMLEAFIAESRDNIETASRCFLELEKSPGDTELINDLFRAIHTIKGSSGLFDIADLTRVVHAAEDVLDMVREGEVELEAEHIDVFLDTLDQVSEWLDMLETDSVLPPDSASASDALSDRLRAFKGGSDTVAGSDSGDSVGAEAGQGAELGRPDWLSEVPAEVLDRVRSDEQQCVVLEYTPPDNVFYSGEDPLHTVRSMPGLEWFSVVQKAPFRPPHELDPYECNLDFRILASCSPDEAENHFRYVRESIRIGRVDEAADAANDDAGHTVVSLDEHARKVLLVQKQVLDTGCDKSISDGRLSSVAAVVRNLGGRLGAGAGDLLARVDQALEQQDASQLCKVIDDILNRPEEPEAGQAVDDQSGEEAQGEVRSVDGSQLTSAGQKKPAPAGSESESPAHRFLKVDPQRVDALMDLVGELVVAKNALPFIARRAENEFGVEALSKELKAQYAVINRLSEDLQSAIMKIRMVPVSSVFQRFPRLVRDLSRKLGKKIDLVLEGEDTEADKNVIENLADPLIHLVRNSIDHGLELPDERKAAGKPETGRILLRAAQHDDQVIIQIIDDGRGIDVGTIKRKAYEKGIIGEQELDSISDRDALQLVFAAGFSTAEQISDISGRGVGMDVVRSAVRDAGGTVSIESEVGSGTRVSLSLPLSMAVSRVMMVEVAGQSYGISMDSIVETVRVPVSSVRKVKNDEAVVLRGRLIPIFRLASLLGVDQQAAEAPEELAVLVMQVGNDEIGLVIDDFNEGLDIIQKPLEGVMSGFPFYSGAALLGDGRVLLVLNVGELLACQ